MKPATVVMIVAAVTLSVGVAATVVVIGFQRGPRSKPDLESRTPPSSYSGGSITPAWRQPDNQNEVQAPSDHPLRGEEIYPRLVRCSALIITPPNSEGSGFVVSTADRLVVTNYHVVGRENKVIVLFPLYDQSGVLITDTRTYLSKPRETGVVGEVIARDKVRDLALIRVERIPIKCAAVPLAGRPAATGSIVYSVGGSGADDNLLWRLTKGTVRGRLQRREQLSSGALDCMILETDAPVNPGDSGGAVMNELGELVAAVSHFNIRQRQVSGNIDVDEVRRFLSNHVSSQ